MPAPAHDQVGINIRAQHASVAQYVEYGVGDAFRGFQIEAATFELGGDIDDVADDREQQFVDAPDDLAIDEGMRRRMGQFELHAAILLEYLDLEIRIQLDSCARIIGDEALGQHGERTTAQQLMQAACTGVAQACDLPARQYVEAGRRSDARADGRRRGGGLAGLVHGVLVSTADRLALISASRSRVNAVD